VTHPAHSPASDSSWRAHEQEARLLAELLRTSRLALLFDATGGSKTSLLTEGLMPLLRRRVGDRPEAAGARESGVVVPFPDQRSRASARGARRRREIVVYFDRWTEPPLAALQVAIHKAAAGAGERAAPAARLRDALADLSNRFDANFIILLDRFEEFLRAPAEREGAANFVDELVEAVRQPGLPANFLLSLNEEARPRLARLRQRIPGFDDFSLKLAGVQSLDSPLELPSVAAVNPPALVEPIASPAPLAVAVPVAASAAPAPPRARHVKKPPPPRIQIRTEDVYTLIETTLARTTASVPAHGALPTRGPLRPAPRATIEQAAARAAAPPHQAATTPVPPIGPDNARANVDPSEPSSTGHGTKRPGAIARLLRRWRLRP
jgi:hypothetical protein